MHGGSGAGWQRLAPVAACDAAGAQPWLHHQPLPVARLNAPGFTRGVAFNCLRPPSMATPDLVLSTLVLLLVNGIRAHKLR